jgi:CO dehydrogenase maturation factor
MIVTLSGKGGAGKTSVAALILDELARTEFCAGRILVIDGDPAMTLHMALDFPEPAATVADVRDSVTLDAKTVRTLPPGTSPADFVHSRLREAGVIAPHRLRQMPFDLMAMGQGEGPGCYCSVNRALADALKQIVERYVLVLIDNEAGVEHLSRLRVGRVDLFLVVTTPGRAAWAVAQRALISARQAGMKLGEIGIIVNRAAGGPASGNGWGLAVNVPHSDELVTLDTAGRPAVELPDRSAARAALRPIVERLLRCA